MMQLHKNDGRGHVSRGWLDSYHTFSFGRYHNPQQMGFSDLRVINEDRIESGQGFGSHSHRDMEIVSYVISGGLRHKDSMGNESVIRPGEVQLMSAGTGVTHSEYNASQTDTVHLLQIWILPEREALQPTYQQHDFAAEQKSNVLQLVVSPDGGNGSLSINQDASIYLASLDPGAEVTHYFRGERAAYLHVIRGQVEVEGQRLTEGDSAAICEQASVGFKVVEDIEQKAELLLFDLRP